MKKIVILLVIALFFYALFAFFGSDSLEQELKEFEVRSTSLSGIVEPGDSVEVDFNFYENNEISRGDLVLFQYAGNDNFLLKKVYGIPGDIIDLQVDRGGEKLLINGRAIVNNEGEEYLFSGARASLLKQYITDYRNRIPEEAYLLLGNLEGGSVDSGQFGLVSGQDILGKVIEQ